MQRKETKDLLDVQRFKGLINGKPNSLSSFANLRDQKNLI